MPPTYINIIHAILQYTHTPSLPPPNNSRPAEMRLAGCDAGTGAAAVAGLMIYVYYLFIYLFVFIQKCDSLAATQVLVQQQLQDRLDSSRKENQRWRTSLEDSLSTTQDLASLKLAGAGAYSRAGNEPFPDRHQREVRRMLDERDEAARREITTLGRAIHSLADSLNVASPLVIGRA
ncbi:hypothetical protein T492DRAFT_316261 [Pavlovales sp. CCMP2436]|nr:hypothetical protein T492DRAFT_316261 [Pavlovales sp. CCMP2436]